MTPIRPGDVIAIPTEAGRRYVQVTHRRAPYADVVRALDVAGEATSAEGAARGRTVFTAMAELGGAVGDEGGARVLGPAPIPAADRDYPAFRVAIRNKAGEILYWWTWADGALSVAEPEEGDGMPVREVMSLDALAKRLAAEVG